MLRDLVIPDPDELNDYESFSSATYGETNFGIVSAIIRTRIRAGHHRFVDLGSGIGTVILEISATFKLLSCIGIELAEIPAEFADNMGLGFTDLMESMGKKHSPFKLIRGSFLDARFKKIIKAATIIFVNNFAFSAALDNALKELFSELSDDTVIISLKSFCPRGLRRINLM